MKNNKGFSLIELIVVIAIMSILAAIVTLGVGTISGSKVKECAKGIEAVLNKARVSSMGKDQVTAQLYIGDDGAYYMDLTTEINGSSDTQTKRVGRSELVLMYSYKDDYSDPQVLKKQGKLNISFDRSSGELKADESGNYCQRIWVQNKKGSVVWTITIYKETGTVEVE